MKILESGARARGRSTIALSLMSARSRVASLTDIAAALALASCSTMGPAAISNAAAGAAGLLDGQLGGGSSRAGGVGTPGDPNAGAGQATADTGGTGNAGGDGGAPSDGAGAGTGGAVTDEPSAPEDLRVGDRARPLNVEGVPLFSWQLASANNDAQTAYQIQVRREATTTVVWDSGKTASAQQSYVPYGGADLPAAESFVWSVRAWNKADQPSAWAADARFDSGLVDSASGWGASWIKRTTTGADASDEYTLLRTETKLGTSPVTRARAYVSANHQFELHVNGSIVDRGPAFAYPGEGYYQASDLTALAQPGQSLAIGLIHHWYGGGQGRPAGVPGVLVRVVVDHQDGSRELIVSDAKWRVRRASLWQTGAPKRSGDSGDFVEWIDLRQSLDGWDKPGFDTTSWEAPKVIGPHPSGAFSSLRAQEPRSGATLIPLAPVAVKTLADGAVVADFGQVVPARPLVKFASGVAGRTLAIRAGYRLTSDGHVSADKIATQGTDMSYRVIQRAGAQEFRSFTYLGFRYLQIEAPAETLDAKSISALVEHADVVQANRAEFESSDSTLNDVFALVQRSALYGAQQQFVDTPTREKGQFLNDAVNISIATMSAWRERDTTQKAIDEFLASQKRYWADGRLNAVYPNNDGQRDIPDFSELFPVWIARYYLESGDRWLLARAYPGMQKVVDYVWSYRNASTGLITNLAGGTDDYEHGIIDWPLSMRYGYDMAVSARTTVNILAVAALRATAAAATVLGKSTDSSTYGSRADALVTSVNGKLRRTDGIYVDGCTGTMASSHASQLANSYALAFDIAPQASRAAVASYVAGLGMNQGPMTAHWLIQALTSSGREDVALKLLTDKVNPGWANVLAQGGTFTWEAWDSRSTGGSESHGWGATVVIDILQSLLGVQLTAPGAAAVSVRPPSKILSFAHGALHTERGEVRVDWSRQGTSGLTLKVTLPTNVRADVALEAASAAQIIASGDGAPAPVVGPSRDARVHYDVGSGDSTFVVSAAP